MGYISVTMGGEQVALDAPDREHRFYGYCVDSSLAYSVLLAELETFLAELRQRMLPVDDWSPLARRLAKESGVAVVQVNTLSESEVARARKRGENRGAIITDTLVQELAERVAGYLAEQLSHHGKHAAGTCATSRELEALCEDCTILQRPLNEWPLTVQARLGGAVLVVLRDLANRGLLP